MPWKDRYTISDERSLADSEVAWPDGRRCCVRVVIDLSPLTGSEGVVAKDLKTPEAYFGMHGGLAAVRDVLKQHDIKTTIAAPAIMAELYPDTIRALRDEGHEIAAHGYKHEDVNLLEAADEKARLARTTEILTAVTGKRPSGWFSLPRQSDKYAGGSISPNTMNLLIDGGYTYMGNSAADDIPHYWVTDFASRRAILAMPYYYHFDDQFFLLFPTKGTGLENPQGLFRNCVAEFDAQYKRGRQFSMTIHPYAMAWPNRLYLLEEFFTYMRGLPGLWVATSEDVAKHWVKTFPASTHLNLEPSIWQDYPDSLS
jgi:peptidoglycan-N-acetylglucosamine deacetylase